MAGRRAMLLLTYRLGDHVDEREYEQWLRDVDNPFFNAVPGVERYANWKVLDEKLGHVAFTHYDLLEIDDLAAWEKVWGNEELQAFAKAWTDRWSVHGSGERYAGVNYQVMLCEEIAAPD